MESFGKEFDRIRDKVPMPAGPPLATATTTGTEQQQQQQGQTCHDETLEKEIHDIRTQLEDAKRKYVMSYSVPVLLCVLAYVLAAFKRRCPAFAIQSMSQSIINQ